MAGEMLQKATRGRLLTAVRLAFYPAFESAEARGFQALTMEAENARGSGDLAKAEVLYSTAAAKARSSSDPSYLGRARDGLARVYQEQRRYREAERIFQDQLEAAVNSTQPNTLIHAGHMSLALLYQNEGRFAEAETHFRAALAETEKAELFPGSGFWCSTSMWLAKFYVARQRYSEAEPLCLRFRSIFVYRESEPVHGSASIGAYGYPFLLNNDTVLPDLQIACAQDIQNAAVNGIDTPELSERNFKRFEDLSSIPAEDLDARIQALTRVLARREPQQYVEARIFRALTREDVVGKLF